MTENVSENVMTLVILQSHRPESTRIGKVSTRRHDIKAALRHGHDIIFAAIHGELPSSTLWICPPLHVCDDYMYMYLLYIPVV